MSMYAVASRNGIGARRNSSASTLQTNENEENDPSQQNEDGLKKGKPMSAPKPVGFWNTQLKKARRNAYLKWLLAVLIICIFILTVLSLFWSVLYSVEKNLGSLNVFVVNFERGPEALLGPMVVQMTESIAHQDSESHLGYITISPDKFNNDPLLVREAVYREAAYAALIVNSNATTLLEQAILRGNTSYDPMGAMQVIYVQARDEQTYNNYIIPELNALQTRILLSFGESWAKYVLSNTNIFRNSLEIVPQALCPAVGFSTYNLRPFTPPSATPAVTIGLIYLIILAFFSFSFFLPIHMSLMLPIGHPPLKFWQVIIWRWCSTIFAYFFMSLAYSLVPLAFQIEFSKQPAPHTEVATSNAYGRGSFAVYWMINFVGMASLGLPCENMAMIIGFPWTSFWLIFWVITNVAASFYNLDLAPNFFKWGYVWPLRNIVQASRVIVFDIYSRIDLNFAILLIWVIVSTCIFPFACWFMRWRSMRAAKSP